MIRFAAAPLLLASVSCLAQDPPPPIIDMHLHALPADAQGPPPQVVCSPFEDLPYFDPAESYPDVFAGFAANGGCRSSVTGSATDEDLMTETLAVLERRNIIGVTSGPLEMVERWRQQAPTRIIPGLLFSMAPGSRSPAAIAELHDEGRLAVLGEVTIQYSGVAADDPAFEPYLAMAEAADMPVGIHIGTGPPGAPYLAFPKYRARLHSPLALEDPLLRHPRLRVYVMHAGWPMLDDTLALLYTHPQVYVEVGVINWSQPRAEFHRYLKALVDAGFGKRIMFGSDQMVWPQNIERGIDAIEAAEFLSPAQKRDIFYNNAARFLRLPDEQIAAHHGR